VLWEQEAAGSNPAIPTRNCALLDSDDRQEPAGRPCSAREYWRGADESELVDTSTGDVFGLGSFDEVDAGLEQEFDLDGEAPSWLLGGPYLYRCLVCADGDDL
jgi:hypothetical protein